MDTTLNLPPYGYGTATPGIVISCVRTWLIAISLSCCSDISGLDKPTCTTGTLEAE